MYLLLLLHFASFSYPFTCFLLPTAFKCHCLPFLLEGLPSYLIIPGWKKRVPQSFDHFLIKPPLRYNIGRHKPGAVSPNLGRFTAIPEVQSPPGAWRNWPDGEQAWAKMDSLRLGLHKNYSQLIPVRRPPSFAMVTVTQLLLHYTKILRLRAIFCPNAIPVAFTNVRKFTSTHEAPQKAPLFLSAQEFQSSTLISHHLQSPKTKNRQCHNISATTQTPLTQLTCRITLPSLMTDLISYPGYPRLILRSGITIFETAESKV